MLHSPYKIVKMFEEEIAHYTGSPYAISVDSCTNALFLCCNYLKVKEVIIPSKTYLSVPMSIINAGGEVIFDKTPVTNHWVGIYQLKPYPIYDAAKRLTSNMYIKNSFMCLSFHIKKHLGIGKGGMILTDDEEAAKWLKLASYDGRDLTLPYDHENHVSTIGYHMYMTPEDAARGIILMDSVNKFTDVHDDSGSHYNYPDVSVLPIFK
jgi:dTDP-4-amino-4,6-dideoxygalactose transaminase